MWFPNSVFSSNSAPPSVGTLGNRDVFQCFIFNFFLCRYNNNNIKNNHDHDNNKIIRMVKISIMMKIVMTIMMLIIKIAK